MRTGYYFKCCKRLWSDLNSLVVIGLDDAQIVFCPFCRRTIYDESLQFIVLYVFVGVRVIISINWELREEVVRKYFCVVD